TDIGGSQDLTADSAAQPLALGQTTVVAQGTLTTPANDGTYHVYIIPQIVSVLEPNLATGPTGRLPDDVNIGQGFYVVIGQTTYFALTTGTSHSAEHIIRDPELATYPNGMWVTLTGTENTYDFREFHHYDPNLDYGSHLGDANYYTVDSNNPTLVLMDQNRAVGAQYECGGSAGGEGALMLPLAGIVGILGTAWTIRRLRFHS
ncbi:MAG: hypothetical protein JXQ73_31265, partial [Phycisphaerae bacterium]|nr:hypothetical protein [Phycisphaerae bacterium]